jgi:hypothetical protein
MIRFQRNTNRPIDVQDTGSPGELPISNPRIKHLALLCKNRRQNPLDDFIIHHAPITTNVRRHNGLRRALDDST